jgi:hypothetical protein
VTTSVNCLRATWPHGNARGRPVAAGFQQALQMSQALGMAENGFERLGFAKQNGGRSGCERAKCHDRHLK